MSTIRQDAANRQNCQKSKGPVSPEGKLRSRRNALKHGLSGYGIVLPDEEEDQVQAQISVWGQGFKGWDERDQLMIEQVAVEHVRVKRCQREERNILIKQCKRADTSWDMDRREDARVLFTKLHRNPLVHSIRLESTLRGCELMIEQWQTLLSLLEPGKPWDNLHRAQALDLLGVANDIRDARMKIDAREGESIVDIQKNLVESECLRLTRLKDDFLVDEDLDNREEAMIGLGIPDRPTLLIRRYEAVCQKRFQAALKWIETSRSRGGKPAPARKADPGQAQDDGDLRVWTMFKQEMERPNAARMKDPAFVKSMEEINAGTIGTPFPPIKLATIAPPRPALPPLIEMHATPLPSPPPSPTLTPVVAKRRKGVRDKRNKRGR
jgi:hypothetical protein